MRYNKTMKRPRLREAINYFQSLSKTVEPAQTVLDMYAHLLETKGEFFAGKMIVDVMYEFNLLQEKKNGTKTGL